LELPARSVTVFPDVINSICLGYDNHGLVADTPVECNLGSSLFHRNRDLTEHILSIVSLNVLQTEGKRTEGNDGYLIRLAILQKSIFNRSIHKAVPHLI